MNPEERCNMQRFLGFIICCKCNGILISSYIEDSALFNQTESFLILWQQYDNFKSARINKLFGAR